MSRYFQDFAYNHILDMRGVLCKRIEEYIDRYHDGETFKALGEELHVSGTTISNVYHNRYERVSLMMLILLAQRLGIDYRV